MQLFTRVEVEQCSFSARPSEGPRLPERHSAASVGSRGPSPSATLHWMRPGWGDLLGGHGRMSTAMALSPGTVVGSCQGDVSVNREYLFVCV